MSGTMKVDRKQQIKKNVLTDLLEYTRYVNDNDLTSYFILASSDERDSVLIAYDFNELNAMIGRLELALTDLKMMAVEKQREKRVMFDDAPGPLSSVPPSSSDTLN